MPPWQALMPEIVVKEDVSSAVTLGGIGVNVSRAIGPILGGARCVSRSCGCVPVKCHLLYRSDFCPLALEGAETRKGNKSRANDWCNGSRASVYQAFTNC